MTTTVESAASSPKPSSLDILASVVTATKSPTSQESMESKKRALATPPITPGDKKRRLSVVPEDVESSPKRPTSAHPGQAVVDQVRNSMKLKEQQKALIEARRGSIGMPLSATTPNKNVAGLSIWTSGAPSDASNGRNGSGEAHVHPATALPRMETMLSPRDGQARELPRPYPMSARPGLPPMIPPPTSGPRSAISPAAMPRPMPMSRNDFMRFFDQMYDQSEHAYHLVSTLNDQVRHSTSLLQTLQSSGVMIEGLVRTHFRELQTQMGEKFAIALTDLNRRMRKVEEKLDITPSPTSAQDLSERLRKMEDSVVIVVEKTKETAPKSAEPRD